MKFLTTCCTVAAIAASTLIASDASAQSGARSFSAPPSSAPIFRRQLASPRFSTPAPTQNFAPSSGSGTVIRPSSPAPIYSSGSGTVVRQPSQAPIYSNGATNVYRPPAPAPAYSSGSGTVYSSGSGTVTSQPVPTQNYYNGGVSGPIYQQPIQGNPCGQFNY